MTHEERVHEILYSCDDREEIAERIASLEELARTLYADLSGLRQVVSDSVDPWAWAEHYRGRVDEAAEAMDRLGVAIYGD